MSTSKSGASLTRDMRRSTRSNLRSGTMDVIDQQSQTTIGAPGAVPDTVDMLVFLEEISDELEGCLDVASPDPCLRMSLHLLKGHFDARIVTPTSLIGASHVPYATANRRLKQMIDAGLIEQRPRTNTGKSFSMHPSEKLLTIWAQLSGRIRRLAEARFAGQSKAQDTEDYYFGGSYADAISIPPLSVLPDPIKLPGGLRVLVHGDPTFMVMDQLKRQFEQVIGCQINQRAFSIDRLREEALRNAERPNSRYDIIAVDLPWVGEFADAGVLMPLDDAMDLSVLDPADFHTAGWRGTHWKGRAYGVPAQTTPELLFYRRDLFAQMGLEPPGTTDALLDAASTLQNPRKGFYGIAWNAARGTALGHTVLMTMADFGQPVLDLRRVAGGFDTDNLHKRGYRATIDTPLSLAAAEFLIELLSYSPPDILSMSWYERVRTYTEGRVAMAYGYTLIAPYFELDDTSPACGNTGYLAHPAVPGAPTIAPVGGYIMGIPANLAPDRLPAAVEALTVFTSPEAQKLYVQNGSRTIPRYSVAADPEVRRTSTIFEAVDGMSWRDELQFWPRPPVPEITDLVQICGEEFHDMLRGVNSPRETLRRAQERADAILKPN